VYAGLFSIDLPLTVRTGQEFNVVVRRVNKRLLPAAPPPPPPGPKIAASGKARGGERLAALRAPREVAAPQVWERYIVGSFQVKIPVSNGAAMRPAEETTLAILKARLEGWPKASPWYPVLLRYVELIAGRLRGVGGDPAAIPPSLGGYQPGRPVREEFTGKVASIVYDRFGDFCGFILDTEDGARRFAAAGTRLADS